MTAITDRQRSILDYIKKEIRYRGYPPSVREIGEAVGLSSSSTVHGHLEQLERKGYIRRDPTKPRAIEVLGEQNSAFYKEIIHVPIVGRVTAGQPILAEENIEDTFPLPQDFVQASDVFMLTVSGDSMINAGIMNGDYVLVRQQNTATNGDIIVALLENEATVKRFFREKDHIRLQPENEAMEPILTKNVSVLGKVIGVFRRIH
ncbi:MAG: transcriptional repressor LexA [Bacillota bacterium]